MFPAGLCSMMYVMILTVGLQKRMLWRNALRFDLILVLWLDQLDELDYDNRVKGFWKMIMVKS